MTATIQKEDKTATKSVPRIPLSEPVVNEQQVDELIVTVDKESDEAIEVVELLQPKKGKRKKFTNDNTSSDEEGKYNHSPKFQEPLE